MSPWLTGRSGPTHIVSGLALVLAALAAFAGTPDRARNARVDVDDLARVVEHEEDHVSAIELAEWIRERRPRLRIVDIRSSADFDAFHVPTAERIPLGELTKTPFRRDETIVLYSEGGTHAAQGWFFLRALGYSRVYFLRGGLYEWLDDVVNPTIPATVGDSAKKAFSRVSDLSRYFGGAPRVRVPRSIDPVISIPAAHDSTSSVRQAVANIRSRGC
jgi:rhodanese-related sulfurtransferase